MSKDLRWLVTCPKGAEELLSNEITALSASEVSSSVGIVSALGDLKLGYRICLWSRLANRVLLSLYRFKEIDADNLYRQCTEIPWENHFIESSKICVDFVGKSESIKNSMFGAQRVKDAIVDRFAASTGTRPNIDTKNPDLRVNARLKKGYIDISIDFSGSSLHKRGYREGQGTAPLKENLASLILARSKWHEISESGGFLFDPMCGSGTFLIEGAMIAADIAPGIAREDFGFLNWKQFDKTIWNDLLDDAQRRKQKGLSRITNEIKGYDTNKKIISIAAKNIENAGLDEYIKVAHRSIESISDVNEKSGLFIVNPPYGERLGENQNLHKLYFLVGEVLKTNFPNCCAGIFTANEESARKMDLSPTKIYKLNNGPINCKLLFFENLSSKAATIAARIAQQSLEPPLNESSSMVLNRLNKNQKRLSAWLRKGKINCYRIYDRDLPEFAAAIDIYDGYILVQEYEAPRQIPKSISNERAKNLRLAVKVFAIRNGLEILYKKRARQIGSKQYDRNVASSSVIKTIDEYAAKFEINLSDYLDTGLFLDHRPLRRYLSQISKGRTFLNLFCYTGTASVVTALSGAVSSLSVDMSKTYLDWAVRNFKLNGIDLSSHKVLREDCLTWLPANTLKFDIIFLDPPTFSNSKKMKATFDMQRDHSSLIEAACKCLNEDGTLIFSNNFKRFQMNNWILETFNCTDITSSTIDQDFNKKKKIHKVWLIKNN